MKLLVLALDGLDADLIYPNLAEFPYLSGLMENSSHGVLVSDDPMTRSAFCTLYTSTPSAKHKKVFPDFDGKIPQGFEDIEGETIFHILKKNKVKFGSLAMPLTCKMKIGEFVVGGFPGVNKFQGKLENLIHPMSIQDIVNYENYHYTYSHDVPLIENVSNEEMEENLVPYEMDRVRVATELLKRHPVDVLFLYFRFFDDYTHFLDVKYKADSEEYKAQVLERYKAHLDNVLRGVFEKIQADNYLVFSDHGRYVKPQWIHNKNGFYLIKGKDVSKSGKADNNLLNASATILDILSVKPNTGNFNKEVLSYK